MSEPEWIIVDREKDDDPIVRGPFPSGEIAGAVRAEMERHAPWNARGNLWIVPASPRTHSPSRLSKEEPA